MMIDEPAQLREAQRIGERLRWAREMLGYSRVELAREIGVDPAFIGKIEAGQRIPSVFLVMSLCHVLHISPQYMLWGSVQGVEGELATKLLDEHPELRTPSAPPFPGKTRKSLRTKGPAAAL